MAGGAHEAALPLALQAVGRGHELFKPAPAVQMFPLYLLAAQVGAEGGGVIGRQCELAATLLHCAWPLRTACPLCPLCDAVPHSLP